MVLILTNFTISHPPPPDFLSSSRWFWSPATQSATSTPHSIHSTHSIAGVVPPMVCGLLLTTKFCLLPDWLEWMLQRPPSCWPCWTGTLHWQDNTGKEQEVGPKAWHKLSSSSSLVRWSTGLTSPHLPFQLSLWPHSPNRNTLSPQLWHKRWRGRQRPENKLGQLFLHTWSQRFCSLVSGPQVFLQQPY